MFDVRGREREREESCSSKYEILNKDNNGWTIQGEEF